MVLPKVTEDAGVAAFHAGDRATLERCYRENFAVVLASAARIVGAVDAETVCHEVFHKLLASGEARASFVGGDMAAWLARVATNRAIDLRRRRAREQPLTPAHEGAADTTSPATHSDPGAVESELGAKRLVERFVHDVLPPKYKPLFEARFLKQLPQREAALALGMKRSTLTYQEEQIREMLRRFVLEAER